MDGSNPRQIINSSTSQIFWPNALGKTIFLIHSIFLIHLFVFFLLWISAIDHVSNELWWGDAKLDFIAVSDLEGGRRAVIVNKRNSKTINHIFAISVFEDWLYFTDWETKSYAFLIMTLFIIILIFSNHQFQNF